MEFTKLFVGYNEKEDFRILIRALDKEEASTLASEYQEESGFESEFAVSELDGSINNIRFDCDYVISSSDRAMDGHELEYVSDLLLQEDMETEYAS